MAALREAKAQKGNTSGLAADETDTAAAHEQTLVPNRATPTGVSCCVLTRVLISACPSCLSDPSTATLPCERYHYRDDFVRCASQYS